MMNITILKDNNSNEQNEMARNLNLILSSHQNDLYFNRFKMENFSSKDIEMHLLTEYE